MTSYLKFWTLVSLQLSSGPLLVPDDPLCLVSGGCCCPLRTDTRTFCFHSGLITKFSPLSHNGGVGAGKEKAMSVIKMTTSVVSKAVRLGHHTRHTLTRLCSGTYKIAIGVDTGTLGLVLFPLCRRYVCSSSSFLLDIRTDTKSS